jgi:hypothetical protein
LQVVIAERVPLRPVDKGWIGRDVSTDAGLNRRRSPLNGRLCGLNTSLALIAGWGDPELLLQ